MRGLCSFKINITAAWAVDREFVYIVLWRPLGRLWGLWFALGCPWAPFGHPLGSLWLSWATFSLPLGVLGRPLAPFWSPLGRPWDPLGCLGAPVRSLGRLWGLWLALGSSMFTVCDACAQNQASWNTPREPREPAKWCQELRLGAPLPHAPGARMTGVMQTPAN